MKLLLSNILYNLILTLFRFSVKFNHNSDLTLFYLKVSDTGSKLVLHDMSEYIEIALKFQIFFLTKYFLFKRKLNF